MTDSTEKRTAPDDTATPEAPADYEAPRVERLLTQEDLDREVLYGGGQGISPQEW